MNIVNLPPLPVLIRSEYLENGDSKRLIKARLATVKSVPGEAFRFEVYIPEYGALYDKLPIECILHKEGNNYLQTNELQLWDCFDNYINVIKKSVINNIDCIAYIRSKKMRGYYVLTIDSYTPSDRLSLSYTEDPEEHKSFNMIALNNGQFALLPNNRVQFVDASLSGSDNPPLPKFKVASKRYYCEGGSIATDDWSYRLTSEESSS
jgi:hypothetical protein